jgi:hypothetical protein
VDEGSEHEHGVENLHGWHLVAFRVVQFERLFRLYIVLELVDGRGLSVPVPFFSYINFEMFAQSLNPP